MANTQHDPNQELIGQGIANIAAPLFGGFAATGAIARTAANIRGGADSPIAGLVHCAFLVLVLALLAPLAALIPLTPLAAILFFVAWNMSDLRRFARVLKTAPRADAGILLPRVASAKMLPAWGVASGEMLPVIASATMQPPLPRRSYGHQDDAHGAGRTDQRGP